MLNFLQFFKKNVKYYGHYLALGYNCEVAYRFFQKCGFVESSLFTWTFQNNISDLIFALKNLDAIYTETPIPSGTMWRCSKTNIHFHGIEPFEMRMNFDKYTAEDFKPYQEELVSRINHLREKFKAQISDEKRTLLAYTYLVKEESREQVAQNILNIKLALDNIGAKNCDLLIILERRNNLDDKTEQFTDKNIYIRYVDEFVPPDSVTTKIYDKKSWNLILKEFRPNFRLKKKKKFKFEEI